MLILAVILAQIFVGIYFVQWLIKNDRGGKEPRSGIRAAIGFGFLALVLAIFLNPSSEVSLDAVKGGSASLSLLVITSIIVGVVEELAKCIPLAIYLWKKPYFNETTDGIFYFGITGVVFGVVETILYTFSEGAGVGIARTLFMPFLHVGFAMWFGYFFARRKVRGTGNWAVVGGLLLAISLHSLYDFGVFLGNIWIILPTLLLAVILNFGVFKLYKISRRQDQALALSSDEHNNFCRQCGKPNPHHNLYCEFCGQRT